MTQRLELQHSAAQKAYVRQKRNHKKSSLAWKRLVNLTTRILKRDSRVTR